MTTTTIDTYQVTVTHPTLSEPLIVELIATSERAAISRDVRLLDAEYVVTRKKPGIWPDGTES